MAIKLLVEPSMGYFHRVKFLRDVNECKAGEIKDVMITRMQGRFYKPDRDERGRFIDNVGVKDNRICAMGLFDYQKKIMDEFYHVFESDQDLQDSFEEVVEVATV